MRASRRQIFTGTLSRQTVSAKEFEDEKDDENDKPSVSCLSKQLPRVHVNWSQLWYLSASELDTARPEWSAGQVAVNMNKDFRLVLEGKASNGGFAIDQLTFNSGDCASMNAGQKPCHFINHLLQRSSRVCRAQSSEEKLIMLHHNTILDTLLE